MKKSVSTLLCLVFLTSLAMAQTNDENTFVSSVYLNRAFGELFGQGKKGDDGMSYQAGPVEGSGHMSIMDANGKLVSLEIGKPLTLIRKWYANDGILHYVPLYDSDKTRWVLIQGSKEITLKVKSDWFCEGCSMNKSETELRIPKTRFNSNLHVSITKKLFKKETIAKNLTWTSSCQKAGYCMACSSDLYNSTGAACAYQTMTYSNYCQGRQRVQGDQVQISYQTAVNFYDDKGKISYKLLLEPKQSTDYENVSALSDCEL